MNDQQSEGGILISAADSVNFVMEYESFIHRLVTLGIYPFVEVNSECNGQGVRFRLNPELHDALPDDYNTLQLCEIFGLQTLTVKSDLEKEILLAMLMAPVTFEYPSFKELVASIRVRQYIVEAARNTALSFHTTKIERPADYWTYSEDSGFTLLPGKSLIEALRMATQPAVSGQLYAFACYRATEYVVLLGIAQELATSNPALFQQLRRHWESRAIMSQQFHDVFLREYGSLNEPLPPKYYVPGDRLWFKNPDERSSDVTGYEGSWVFYLGGGIFNNFWKCDKPYTLTEKCLEIYHWRSGIYTDIDGHLQMDEDVVDANVRSSMNNPAEVESILDRMMRLRDPMNVYAEGGCIDASREYPRWVCPDASDLVLPDE
jgi:hypothetical protein